MSYIDCVDIFIVGPDSSIRGYMFCIKNDRPTDFSGHWGRWIDRNLKEFNEHRREYPTFAKMNLDRVVDSILVRTFEPEI